jgi:hypothetical protein
LIRAGTISAGLIEVRDLATVRSAMMDVFGRELPITGHPADAAHI